MRRVYEGSVGVTGDRTVIVNRQPLPLRLDLANHSPTGFNWGYGGSGPAQLALALLADHFKHHPEDMALARTIQDRKGGPIPPREELEVGEEISSLRVLVGRLSVRCHQHFKAVFVAGLDMNAPWKIDSDGIRDVLIQMLNNGIPSRFEREEPV